MTPNTPKNPEIITVNKFIGICRPNVPPNTLKKKRNKIPIPNLTEVWAKNLVGLIGAPTTSRKIINIIITEIMMIDFMKPILSTCPTYLYPMQRQCKKELFI